jgi:hypothetical protein
MDTRRNWLILGLTASMAVARPAVAETPGEKKTAMDGPCGGKQVPIGLVMGRRECEEKCHVSGPLKGIEGRLEVGAAQVAPGGEVKLRAVFRNSTRATVVLPFVWHAGPMNQITVIDANGRPVEVEGTRPTLSAAGGGLPGPPYLVCLQLAGGGEATLDHIWRAVRWRYGQGRGPMGAPIQEVAGPLPKGRYQLRLVTMLQDQVGTVTAPIEVR